MAVCIEADSYAVAHACIHDAAQQPKLNLKIGMVCRTHIYAGRAKAGRDLRLSSTL